MNGLEILKPWDIPWLCCGFAGRIGGVSKGPHASLNFSYKVGDDPSAVDENWRRLRRIIGSETPVARLRQVHRADVVVRTRANASEFPQADGMVTAEPDLVMGIFSADCVPILMIDAERKIAAALHAGWRSTIAKIAESGVRAMQSLGARPEAIRAAMGPAIGICCFEVHADLAARFAREVEGASRHTRAGGPGKAYLDLRAILADQLASAGIPRESIISAGPCTRCASDRYFSRRASGGIVTGLQLSFIRIKTGA